MRFCSTTAKSQEAISIAAVLLLLQLFHDFAVKKGNLTLSLTLHCLHSGLAIMMLVELVAAILIGDIALSLDQMPKVLRAI